MHRNAPLAVLLFAGAMPSSCGDLSQADANESKPHEADGGTGGTGGGVEAGGNGSRGGTGGTTADGGSSAGAGASGSAGGTGSIDPVPYPAGLDAVIEWGNGKAYFFHRDQYLRYDLQGDTADSGYPKSTGAYWPSLWPEDIDAAVGDGAGKAYFFRGDEYVRYDIAADRGDTGYPRPIIGNWPAFMNNGIDAALRVGDRWHFFKDNEVARVDTATFELDAGYPALVADIWPGLDSAAVDAAFTSSTGKAYLFQGEHYFRYDNSLPLPSLDAGYPLVTRWYWPGLWDPNEGTGHPGERLPPEVAPLLADEPDAEELAARKTRCAASVSGTDTDLSVQYPLYLESVEERLGAYGCCLLLKASGAHRFRCATDTAGPRPLAIDPFSVGSVDWRNAAHHVDQVSQGDFSADAGTPLSVFASDDGTFSIDSVSANGATGSISGGLNIKVAYVLNGEERVVGFSHLNVNVPGYVIDAAASGESLPIGTAFGFIGYTGNLWIGAPPEADAPYGGNGAGLPVSHSHLWFKDDAGNHMDLRASTRESIDYSGIYPYGGG